MNATTMQRGRTYRIRWVDPKTRKMMSEACGRDKAFARLRRDAKKGDLRDGLSGILQGHTLSDLRDQLSQFMVGKSVHTIRKTCRSVQDVIDLCGDRRVQDVDRGFIMEFRATRLAGGVATATVNKDLRQIKSALSYAVDAGWLRTNPLWRWKDMQMREPEKRIRVVEPAEFRKLLDACDDPGFRVLLIVGYFLGLRRTELINLRWSVVDFDAGVVHVENIAAAGELTKSRKNRVLPMPDVVRQELTALFDDVPKAVEGGEQRPKSPHCFTWLDGTPYRADWATNYMARTVERAAIAHCSLHDLRRSFSTLAQRAGVDKATVKNLGGWSTIGVVERHYTGEVGDVRKRAMRKVSAMQGVA